MSEKPFEEELAKLRKAISSVDDELLAQFARRMGIAEGVAEYKAQTQGAVFAPERERELIDSVRNRVPQGMEGYAEVLMRTLMRLSRERQYDLLMHQDTGWALGKALDQAARMMPPVHTVAFPGTMQSYSGQAAARIYPDAALIPVRSFASACRQVVDGNVDAAVLPLENSTAGTVEEAYSLLEKHALYIQACIDVQIRHALMAIPGVKLSDIRRVISHPQALGQCSMLISGMGWEAVEAKNTAFAAQAVREKRDPALAALASPEAAVAEGLTILLPQASNTPCNQTRFIAVGRTLTLPPDAERISLLVQTPNEAGALAEILNIFSDLGIDMAKIQSRPIPNRPWEYSFYVDFMAAPDSRAARRALYQIDKEAQKMRFLGWYAQAHAGSSDS